MKSSRSSLQGAVLLCPLQVQETNTCVLCLRWTVIVSGLQVLWLAGSFANADRNLMAAGLSSKGVKLQRIIVITS